MPIHRTRSLLVAASAACLAFLSPAATQVAHADAAGQSREAVIAQYQSVLLPALAVPNDWNGSVNGCVAGTTGPAYQQATLTAINYLRGLAGVAAVSLDAGLSVPAQAAALVMDAQGDLSHFPPSSWPCWTQQAADGASHSNLYLGRSGADAMVGYVFDPGSNNALVGHRRWVLYPRTTVMGTGDTSGSNALLVFGGPLGPSSGAWVPWPTAGYFPWQLEPAGRWSLSVAGANFDAATVSASIAGAPLPVSVTPPQYGFGDNTLSWQVTLPEPSSREHPADLNVDVAVNGIRLGDGSVVSHTYTVNLIDASPREAPSSPETTSVKRNAGGILVTWLPSEDAGGDSVTYEVTATPVGRKAARLPVRTCTATTTTCQLTRTVRTVTYRVSVIARNSVGTSDPSTMVSPGRRR